MQNKLKKSLKSIAIATVAAIVSFGVTAPSAQAATATINAVSFKAPVFDSYDHATGGGVWNDGSVTWDKGELLGTNYKCGDIASFMLELNVAATPTKQPAPYKAEITLNYTWDATGQSGTSLTPLATADHLKVNTGVIRNASGATIGAATGTNPSGVPTGYDSGFNAAGLLARVATSPAPAIGGNGGSEFTSGATKTITFTVENIQAGANIVVRSDAVIHCKPNSSPTGNMQAALTSINVTYPGALEAVSAGNQTVNFRGVGNLAGLGSSLAVTKSISTNGTDCTATTSTRTFASAPATVLYCYTVTNTGNNDITNVMLKDDNATVSPTTDDVVISMSIRGSPVTTPFSLLVGETATGSWSHTYASSGTYTNIVSATSSAPTVTASAAATVGSTPALSLSKSQTSGTPSGVGDLITYNLVLTNNTGNNSGADVTDTNVSKLTCGSTTVNAPAGTNGTLTVNNVSVGSSAGATFTCTATHLVTQADVTNGTVSNFFTASKQSTTYTSNTVTTPIVVRPLTYDLSVTKTQTSTAQPRSAGEVITYDVQVTNIGTGTLTNVSLADLLSGAVIGTCRSVATGTPTVSLPIASFTAGSSFICSVSYTVIAGDVTDLAVTNTARATATGATTFNSDSNTVITPIITNPSISVLKIQATGSNANTGQYPSAVGQVLTYGISVLNNGNVALTGVIVTDANADSGSLICSSPFAAATTSPGVSLAAGATIECTASHTVTAADLTTGSITNVASASGTGGSTPVSANSANITTVAALRIVKSRVSVTNGANATTGDTITYSIVVTNTGEVTLTNLVINDPNATVTCPGGSLASLAAGASVTCSATHVATYTEAAANQALNTASVTSTQITGAIYSNTVTTPLVSPPAAPHVSIVKSRTSSAPVNEGDVVTYSITVTSDGPNGTGPATVTAISDPNANTLSCPGIANTASFSTVMARGDSFTCTATHTVTSVDIRAGSVSNTASVTATDGSSGNLNATSNTVTDPLTETKSLGVVKSYTSAAPTAAGNVVTYSIVTTNTGTVTLTNVSTSDPLLPTLTCSPTQPVASLIPGASYTCTGSYTVTAADVTAGHVINTATATGTYNSNVTVTGTSNTINLPLSAPAPAYVPAPGLTVTKQLTATVNGKVGDVISYKITVTNSGDTYLTGVTLTDANAVMGTCSVTLPTALAQGESFTCVATHVVTDADVKAGKVDNSAVASSPNAGLSRTSNVVTIPLTAAPSLSVTKALAGTAPSKVGDVISYSIVVTNSGNVTLTNVAVTDANAVLGTCAPTLPATLAVGSSSTCTASHVVTDADFAAGHVDNVAAATGTSAAGPVNGSSEVKANSNIVTVPLVAAPAITVVKTIGGNAPEKTGDVISYSIVVTNSGNVTLTNVAVTDANAVLGTCAPTLPATLAVGSSSTCTASHVVTDADFAAGHVDNVAAATGTSAAGPVNGSSEVKANSNVVTVPLVAAPAIEITKKQVGALPTKLGGYIKYSIVVTNTGNVNLHQVTVSDDNAEITDCSVATPAAELAIGASFTCTAQHALTSKDVLAGKVVNIASATSAENATASSGAAGSGSGSGSGSSSGSGSGSGSTDPGSVVVPSNEVVTVIKIAGMPRIGKYVWKPNGGTVVLSDTVLKNPKLTTLAFTGDYDSANEDGWLMLAIAGAIAIALGMRRRLLRK